MNKGNKKGLSTMQGSSPGNNSQLGDTVTTSKVSAMDTGFLEGSSARGSSNNNSNGHSNDGSKDSGANALPPKAYRGDFNTELYQVLMRFSSYPDKALPEFIPDGGSMTFSDWTQPKLVQFIQKASPDQAKQMNLDRMGSAHLRRVAGSTYLRLQPTNQEMEMAGYKFLDVGGRYEKKYDSTREDPAWQKNFLTQIERAVSGSKVLCFSLSLYLHPCFSYHPPTPP